MKMDTVIFREYDIRGVYNEQFDLGFAKKLGQAYVAFLAKEAGKRDLTVTIGHDARLSSPDITNALAEGMMESGAVVKLIGMVTTPMSYFTTFAIPGVDGAIMVTGSHNPPEYNGFKISVGKGTIFGEKIQQLREIIQRGDFIRGEGRKETIDIFPAYLAKHKEEFGQLKPIKVVLDCGNGAGGVIARKLFNAVGIDPEILFEEPDGRFPNHHPDPTVEKNLKDLVKRVKETGAVAGIGFDGDADRIGLVDHTGKMIYGDELICLIAKQVLKVLPGKKIIGDVKCSDRMFTYIKTYGGEPIMWKTGHSLIKEKIKVEKSPFGGEMSGHIFFSDRNYGYDDAVYAGLRVVELLSETGKTIPELLADLPPAFNTPEIRIDTTEEKKHLIVERLKQEFAKPGADFQTNLIDGIRVSFKDGWALARASNTQPVLVLRFEASTQAGLDRIRDRFEAIVNPLLES